MIVARLDMPPVCISLFEFPRSIAIVCKIIIGVPGTSPNRVLPDFDLVSNCTVGRFPSQIHPPRFQLCARARYLNLWFGRPFVTCESVCLRCCGQRQREHNCQCRHQVQQLAEKSPLDCVHLCPPGRHSTKKPWVNSSPHGRLRHLLPLVPGVHLCGSSHHRSRTRVHCIHACQKQASTGC